MALSPYVQAMQELFRANTRSREFPAHGAKVHSVAWSCCGRRLASGSFDKTASVFLLEKDRLVSSSGTGRAGSGPWVPGPGGHLERPLGPVPGRPGSPWTGTGDSGRYQRQTPPPGPDAQIGGSNREWAPVVGTRPGRGVRVCTGTRSIAKDPTGRCWGQGAGTGAGSWLGR